MIAMVSVRTQSGFLKAFSFFSLRLSAFAGHILFFFCVDLGFPREKIFTTDEHGFSQMVRGKIGLFLPQ
jgi:hypothetical protein